MLIILVFDDIDKKKEEMIISSLELLRKDKKSGNPLKYCTTMVRLDDKILNEVNEQEGNLNNI